MFRMIQLSVRGKRKIKTERDHFFFGALKTSLYSSYPPSLPHSPPFAFVAAAVAVVAFFFFSPRASRSCVTTFGRLFLILYC